FFGSKRTFFSGIKRIVFSYFKTCDIPIAIVKIRHRNIVFFYTGFHFLEQLFLKIFGMCCTRFIISIFCLQIGNYLRIITFVEPIIIINTNIAVGYQLFGNFFSNRFFYILKHVFSFLQMQKYLFLMGKMYLHREYFKHFNTFVSKLKKNSIMFGDLMGMMGKLQEAQRKVEETKKRLDTVYVDEKTSDNLLAVTVTANRQI